ncbi:galactonate dehydratase [Plantactinospora sp. ZYX-F-223]|uniref:galactonate dehydratase n=1 Tax=Plantactinospora sp. ZYX-F-223 TaxID=3144103 RepID=UPI0031FC386B
MKITDVEVLVLPDGDDAMILVAVDTDDGVYGLGEVGVRTRYRAVLGALEHLRELVVGEDPARVEHLWQVMFRRGFFPGDRTVAAAIAAIDVALWDIRGKVFGVPVHALLGGQVRDRVDCYTHVETKLDPEATADSCRALVAEGWRHLRLAVQDDDGVLDPRAAMRGAIANFHAARAAVGDEIELAIDVHTRLDPPEAVTLCREIESARPYFVEDPLRSEGLEGYRMLRLRTGVPLAAGEQLGSKWEFRRLIEEDLVDHARVDVAIAGGLTESKKIAGWCETHYIQLAPHNPLGPVTTASALHLSLATPNVSVQEQHRRQLSPEVAALFTGRPLVRDGYLSPPEGPGLGIDLDRSAARRLHAVAVERPHLRRPDGAFTNW